MEHYKIYSIESNFVTRKLIEVNDLLGGQYSDNNNIRFKTRMLRPYWCDYSDAYIIMKKTIDLLAATANENESHAIKNNSPFRSCISKISNSLIGNTEDLDIVMPMYNFLEYSRNYSMTSRSWWNYYRHKIAEVYHNDSQSKSFEYRTKKEKHHKDGHNLEI